MRPTMVLCLLLSLVVSGWAASPGAPDPDRPVVSYRVETAEVHIPLSAFDRRNVPVNNLSLNDLRILRDGVPATSVVELTEHYHLPFAATVLIDVSESMGKTLPVAREAFRWIDTHIAEPADDIGYFDFDDSIYPSGTPKPKSTHLTSLYDGLIQIIPAVHRAREGRRALILFTDGEDTLSYHMPDDVIEAALREDVAIYAIAPAIYPVRYDADVLQRLTMSTGGRFFTISNADEMIYALKLITQDLREGYELILRAEKRAGGQHQIQVSAAGRPLQLYYKKAYYQPTIRPVTVELAGNR